ncbi:MAG: ATP-binding cassette domain-containing protein, partial [Pseudanabaena sp. M109S1SP1A06QC]|nr:ATP-binding cassette domain-containing protein [Pseudanabaena sp. M109S1SP1A06QC]
MNLSNSISENQAILKVEDVNVFYSSNSPAVAGVNLEIAKNQITAFIGPSGCGKSTILRCFNRLNDLIEGAKVRGKITFNGHNLY